MDKYILPSILSEHFIADNCLFKAHELNHNYAFFHLIFSKIIDDENIIENLNYQIIKYYEKFKIQILINKWFKKRDDISCSKKIVTLQLKINLIKNLKFK